MSEHEATEEREELDEVAGESGQEIDSENEERVDED